MPLRHQCATLPARLRLIPDTTRRLASRRLPVADSGSSATSRALTTRVQRLGCPDRSHRVGGEAGAHPLDEVVHDAPRGDDPHRRAIFLAPAADAENEGVGMA